MSTQKGENMKSNESIEIVKKIESTGCCNNQCSTCPLYHLCQAMPSCSKKNVALIWLG